jgi:hypothetical protein
MPLTISGLRNGRYRLASARDDGAGQVQPGEVTVNGVLKLPVSENTTYVLTEM